MPKRDEKYMQAQRDNIARAALDVLIEKGYHETTLRDICRAAGVSNGALYSYFPTRDSVIIAACLIDHMRARELPVPTTWQEYIAPTFPDGGDITKPRTYRSRRLRLSLQFAAEMSQMDEIPEGAPELYTVYREWFQRSLESLRQRGVISLPWGIELTTEMHLQIAMGYQYVRTLHREDGVEQIIKAFETSLALTAGLVEAAE